VAEVSPVARAEGVSKQGHGDLEKKRKRVRLFGKKGVSQKTLEMVFVRRISIQRGRMGQKKRSGRRISSSGVKSKKKNSKGKKGEVKSPVGE